MECVNWWENAKKLNIQTGPEIVGGFNVGFDDAIPEETRDELMKFVYWVEDNYPVPVTLWVDFKYNHYLMTRDKKRVGYLFYWADFENYPVLEKEEDIPVIELPVRTENWTMKEILGSFIGKMAETLFHPKRITTHFRMIALNIGLWQQNHMNLSLSC